MKERLWAWLGLAPAPGDSMGAPGAPSSGDSILPTYYNYSWC